MRRALKVSANKEKATRASSITSNPRCPGIALLLPDAAVGSVPGLPDRQWSGPVLTSDRTSERSDASDRPPAAERTFPLVPTRRIGVISYTHLRAHETRHDLVCRLLLEKKKI